MSLDYNEVIQFMKEFGADFLNKYDEIIIDEASNTYINLKKCKTLDNVKTYFVYALCRPIGKGLERAQAERLLAKVNKYFNTELTREEMRLMYQQLCYESKFEEFESFIKRGFPIEELRNGTT